MAPADQRFFLRCVVSILEIPLEQNRMAQILHARASSPSRHRAGAVRLRQTMEEDAREAQRAGQGCFRTGTGRNRLGLLSRRKTFRCAWTRKAGERELV